jgi:hypothetical protein
MRLATALRPALLMLAMMISCTFASTASAEVNTQLCKVHEGLVCPAGKETTSVSMTNVGAGKLLNSLAPILCLEVEAKATPLKLDEPPTGQVIHVTELGFVGCGTESAHANCIVTTVELPLLDLVKTGLDEGVLKALSGDVHVLCKKAGFFGATVDCHYELAGTEFVAGSGHLTAESVPIDFVEGSFYCPGENTLDGLLESAEGAYILQPESLHNQLCKVHESLICPAGKETTSVSMTNVGAGKLLNSLATILCLEVEAKATPLEFGEPPAGQVIHVTELGFAGCGTDSAHTNCEITTEELPLLDLVKTGLDEGVLKALSGEVHVLCKEAGPFKVTVDCHYELAGTEFVAGSGHLTAESVPIDFVEGSFYCPEGSTINGLLEAAEGAYILQPESLHTQLCKVHESSVCLAGKETTSVSMSNVGAGKLLSSLATILCLEVEAKATPLELGEPPAGQVIHVTELGFAGCGTESAHTNCEVTAEELPLQDLVKTGLDEGVLKALSGEVHVLCKEVGFFKVTVDCHYELAGTEFVAGSGHLTAEGVPIDFVEGSFFCPEGSTIDGLLEAAEATYILQ